MKFGRNLSRNEVPEWATYYIKYKALKKLIKSTAETSKQDNTADTAEFFFSLDRNLEDVDSFYNKKYADAARRLKLLEDRYGKPIKLPTSMDRDEVEDLMGALLELRGQLRKLQWYGEVNRRGFIKITKKLDKKVAKDSTQRRYLESKVDPKEFATNINLSDSMKIVNDWLSKLGDVKLFDDKSSTHSSHSLHRVSSKVILDLPVGTLDKVDHAIRNDDASSLMIYLEELNLSAGGDKDIALLLLNLLQRAITCKAKNCVDKLLDQVESLDEGDDLNKRNCIHRFVITMGRPKRSSDGDTAADETHLDDTTNYITPAAPPILAPPSSYAKELDGSKRFGRDDKSVVLLEHVLDKLRLEQRDALCTRDVYGRMPLHYAAQHGLAVVCQVITERMQAWGQFDVSAGLDAPYWQDLDGYAPLHLSVIGGHPLTVKAILEAEDWRGVSDRKAAVSQNISKSGEVLALATKANFVVIVRLLVEAGVDLDYQDDQGETALHVAARFGHTECASALLDGSGSQRANTEIGENAFGWTPLFIASVDGHLGIVELLIAAEADLDKMDTSGWTAKEHAALRGHMNIARLLAATTIAPYGSDSEASTVNSPSPPSSVFNSCSPPSSNGSIADRKSNLATSSNAAVRTTEPVKTFGHRYLTKETMVLVSLGTMDTRKAIEAVNLDRIPFTSAHSTLLDTALSVVVSATNANGEPSITDLPVQDNVSTEPIVFTTNDATKVKLLFDIVPTYAGTNEQVVGRAVALLSSIKPSIGSKRISLQGDVTVPIIAANTLEVIGSVNFNFLVITPFTHPNMTITENQTYWKSMTSTMVIGHRGDSPPEYFPLGLYLTDAKVWAKMLPPEALFSLVKTLFRYLNVRCERWYDASDPSQSFIAAANLGASYVEFDVQLTKDHVPVIYHDFLVSETGIDAPVHTLTLEQFLHVNDARTPRPSRPSSPDPTDGKAQPNKVQDPRRHRSMSAGNLAKDDVSEMSERMKHTRDFKIKGFKSNSRGNFIQAPFTTLEEMFKKLPESIGFNIEMKYPMLHESEEQEMDTYAVELNSFVDTVLTKVYDLGKKRNVIFSSFNPDICLLLSFKQPSIPILFLTDAGTSPTGDIRASSLQEAIRFASRWNLLGVVSAAEPLVISPRLVKVVKESGLVCVSYGTVNNDPDKVKLQVDEGIDAVIVDSVLAIRKGLTASESKIAPKAATVATEG